MARKPTKEEFKMVAKVSIAGIAIIGTIGFLIYLLMVELPRALF
ncbi:MAG: protein translocase SEC61 complex subunit gamma [Archaeoglobi archaeon]|nr:protein translocase SEC61 complex subunit gamma [Candidatus Mnemosynella sp.]